MSNSPFTLAPARPDGWSGYAALAVFDLGLGGVLLWWLLGGTVGVEFLYLVFVISGFAIAGLMLVFNAQRKDGLGGPSALGWVFLFSGVLCWVLAPVPNLVTGQHAVWNRDRTIGVVALVTLALLIWAFIAQRRRVAAARARNERPIEPAWSARKRGPRFQPPPWAPKKRSWRLVAFSIGMTLLTPLMLVLGLLTHPGLGKQVAMLGMFSCTVASWAILVGERWPVPGPRPLGWVFIVIGWVLFAAADLWLFVSGDSADASRMAIVLLVEALAIAALALWGWTRQRAWITWYFGPQQSSGPSGQADVNRSRRI